MNNATFIGNLTSDAVRKEINGNQFTTFSVAVNYKTKQKETTQYISCIMSGDTSNLIGYLTKGKKVAVNGRISCRAYMGKDNAPHADLQLSVREIELCGGNTDVKSTQSTAHSDGLPF